MRARCGCDRVPVINPGNLIFYNGDGFPAWKGDMLLTDEAAGAMLRIEPR